MLQKELSFINDNIRNLDIVNLKISKASVGWHLDHSLKVINGVLGAITESDPKEYYPKFNFLRFIVFLKGSFPRGKAKSPKRVLPPEIILEKALQQQLNLAEEKIKIIPKLQEKQHFSHPIFKQLNKKQTIKFLQIHTQHHLNIVRDILK